MTQDERAEAALRPWLERFRPPFVLRARLRPAAEEVAGSGAATLRVAIDGPAGSGKSSVAKAVAEGLGSLHFDTGALYRAVGVVCAERGVDQSSVEAGKLAERLQVVVRPGPTGGEVWVDGADYTGRLRTPEASAGASAVSAVPGVRDALSALQRRQAERGGVVMEGRDIGSVVMPEAELKVFLTASPEARAERRLADLQRKGIDATLSGVMADLLRRDHADSSRAVAPLVQAPGAMVFDTSALTLSEVVDTIMALTVALADA